MTIELVCECGTVLHVPESAAGRQGRCKVCGRQMMVPTAEELTRKRERELDPRFARGSSIGQQAASGEPVRGFWSDAARGFVLNGSAINLIPLVFVWILLLLMVFLSYAMCVGILGKFIVGGWLCAFCMNIIRETAGGEDDIPTLNINDGIWEDIVVPLAEFIGSALAVLAPCLIFLLLHVTTDLIGMDYAARGLAVAGLFAWPAALLMVSLGGWTAPFQLDMLFLTIVRSFGAYVAILLLLVLTAGLASLFIGQVISTGTDVLAAGRFSLGTMAATQLIQAYALIVSMRCIGLYYRHFKGLFPWSAG